MGGGGGGGGAGRVPLLVCVGELDAPSRCNGRSLFAADSSVCTPCSHQSCATLWWRLCLLWKAGTHTRRGNPKPTFVFPSPLTSSRAAPAASPASSLRRAKPVSGWCGRQGGRGPGNKGRKEVPIAPRRRLTPPRLPLLFPPQLPLLPRAEPATASPAAPSASSAASDSIVPAGQEYEVFLQKPLGIRFARGADGEAYVARSDPALGATEPRVTPGDKLLQVSASFGADVWDAKNFGQVRVERGRREGEGEKKKQKTAS